MPVAESNGINMVLANVLFLFIYQVVSISWTEIFRPCGATHLLMISGCIRYSPVVNIPACIKSKSGGV